MEMSKKGRISIWLNTVLPLFQIYVHVMWVYFVFTMCGMFTNFETVWNGYLMDMTLFYGLFMTRCLCKRFASVHFCIIYFKPHQFFALHSGYDVADL